MFTKNSKDKSTMTTQTVRNIISKLDINSSVLKFRKSESQKSKVVKSQSLDMQGGWSSITN